MWAIAGMMLAAFALLCADMTMAVAQERPRTIFDLLFGSRQSRQQPEAQPKDAPQRSQLAKPRRAPKAATPAKRIAAPPPPKPDVTFVEKQDDARKILVVGDFIGGGLAEGLDVAFAVDPGIRVASRINGSSGFVRGDHFDWPSAIGGILDEEKPAVVVVMIGANDRQAITAGGASLAPRSPEWSAEYQRRVARFAQNITDRHYPLIWVGQPPFRPRGMSQDMLALNEIYRAAAEKAGGQFVDVWDGFVDEDGNFSQTGFDINGQTARLRGNDGINTTSAGKRKLAFYAEKPLKALLGGGRDSREQLPAAGAVDASKPVDRIAPVSLRDIDRDESGVLLGGGPGAPARKDTAIREKKQPASGRADDFSWPRKSAD